jgi:hypothetical protein
MTGGCLGGNEANMWYRSCEGGGYEWSTEEQSGEGWALKAMKLKVGDVQSLVYSEGDPPPFYKLDAPRKDTTKSKKRRKRKRSTGTEADGGGDGEGANEDVAVEGFEGKAKGMQQVLWERGLWKKGMIQKIDVDKDKKGRGIDMSMSHVLSMCTDFAEEWSAFKKIVHDRGHILRTSPKGHPELAGVGVEYGWGGSKLVYRRTNDCVAKNLHTNIVNSFLVLTLARTRKYARRARAYRSAYRKISELGTTDEDRAGSFQEVEKFVALSKIHRCILNQETRFLRLSLALRCDICGGGVRGVGHVCPVECEDQDQDGSVGHFFQIEDQDHDQDEGEVA